MDLLKVQLYFENFCILFLHTIASVDSETQLTVSSTLGAYLAYVYSVYGAVPNPVPLGFWPGDKIRLISHISGGAGADTGRVLTLVDPSTITVLENDLTVDGSTYKFEVFRRMSI